MMHILNGDATRWILEQTDIEGSLIVWSDVLHEGPVPPDDDLADWIRTRAAFLASFDTMAEREVLDSYLVAQAALETAPEHDEVVFWFEHDLYDQLLLIRHLNWWQRSGLDPVRAGLVCIGEYPGIADFHGLGELSPTQLAGLLPGRQTIGAAQLDLGREAWEAFTASDPTAFQAMRDRDTSALPFLSGAVTRMLEEYPATGTGLGRTCIIKTGFILTGVWIVKPCLDSLVWTKLWNASETLDCCPLSRTRNTGMRSSYSNFMRLSTFLASTGIPKFGPLSG
jgi:hypothetical protein